MKFFVILLHAVQKNVRELSQIKWYKNMLQHLLESLFKTLINFKTSLDFA